MPRQCHGKPIKMRHVFILIKKIKNKLIFLKKKLNFKSKKKKKVKGGAQLLPMAWGWPSGHP
jgi:hypothetical protein